jgi:hypothetical protein
MTPALFTAPPPPRTDDLPDARDRGTWLPAPFDVFNEPMACEPTAPTPTPDAPPVRVGPAFRRGVLPAAAVDPIPVWVPLPAIVLDTLAQFEADGARVGMRPHRDPATGRIVGVTFGAVPARAAAPHVTLWQAAQQLVEAEGAARGDEASAADAAHTLSESEAA